LSHCATVFLFLTNTSPNHIYTLSLHDALPISRLGDIGEVIQKHAESHGYSVVREYCGHGIGTVFHEEPQVLHYGKAGTGLELKRSEEHTSELQSRFDLVCRLLLEKKKKSTNIR